MLIRACALSLLLALPIYSCGADYCYTCERDEYGKIKRNPVARYDFKQANPCPSTGSSKGSCPGYIIDHITPLACGGLDVPLNMQWQTKADALAKDKWERKSCVTAIQD